MRQARRSSPGVAPTRHRRASGTPELGRVGIRGKSANSGPNAHGMCNAIGAMRKTAYAFAALAVTVVAFHAPPRANPATPAARATHVVLVTLDGLRGDYLGNADGYRLNIPTLRRLIRQGAFSSRTLSVF